MSKARQDKKQNKIDSLDYDNFNKNLKEYIFPHKKMETL